MFSSRKRHHLNAAFNGTITWSFLFMFFKRWHNNAWDHLIIYLVNSTVQLVFYRLGEFERVEVHKIQEQRRDQCANISEDAEMQFKHEEKGRSWGTEKLCKQQDWRYPKHISVQFHRGNPRHTSTFCSYILLLVRALLLFILHNRTLFAP